MSVRTDREPSAGDVVTDGGALVAALGMGTMVLFPFALPLLLLLGVAVVPLLVLALPVAVVAGVIAAPILAVRKLRRRSKVRREDAVDRDPAPAGAGLRGARAVRP